ncbi:MAG: hypothetical protein PHS93_09700, partial [Candidatus Omnitrophica bacterium]|nr:hypothetical protein [Candidatus Omnitrophota bacterium]
GKQVIKIPRPEGWTWMSSATEIAEWTKEGITDAKNFCPKDDLDFCCKECMFEYIKKQLSDGNKRK